MGHAKANCCGWQESEAWGKQLRRGDHADTSLFGTCVTESFCVPAWGLSLYYLKVASRVIRIWLSGGGEGSEAAAAVQEYALMLKHRIWQPAFASSVAVGALGEFVGGLHPAHEITGADGAQRRCWNGWVSSGRADVRKIGESCCMFLSQNCPNSLLFLSAVTAEFQKRFFCSRI